MASRFFATNVAQLRVLTGADYLAGCDFRLTGVVTLVDTNRNLVVLQDTTGAAALNFSIADQPIEVGRLVTLTGSNACPMLASYPDFPHRPSGQSILSSFEVPVDSDTYKLTRVRGYLHPRISGNYRFYIASDDSSELWLSTDSNPANIRRIATVLRFLWTDPHQWMKDPAQRSELILLKAGETYYIEAVQEQKSAAEHLAVAWQEPAPGMSEITVIDGGHLTPFHGAGNFSNATTQGVLREFWTNYFAGNVENLSGARPYESALTVESLSVTDHGPGNLPVPEPIVWNQPLAGESNFCWVETKGVVRFKAIENGVAMLEIFDGQSLIPVRAPQRGEDLLKQLQPLTNAIVRVEGVCEGTRDLVGPILPKLIWATASNSISLMATGPGNEFILPTNQSASAPTDLPPAMGYFGTRGVVTFNDRVFDRDLIVIQADRSAWQITPEYSGLKSNLRVGHYVDLGGPLSLGNFMQTITPSFIADLGWHSMPLPVVNPQPLSSPGKLEGKWTELDGVARSVNTNGTLCIAGESGTANLWIGQTAPDSLPQLVDARLRARGVLMPSMQDMPLLLVPSPQFIDVVKAPPREPFAEPKVPIATLLSGHANSVLHRIHLAGAITYRDAQSFFIQDTSGGIRVRAVNQPATKVGDWIEVVAFPALDGFGHALAEPLIRATKPLESIRPKNLDLSEALSSKQSGLLVQADATLLAMRTNGVGRVLELQEQQRVFVATLAPDQGELPSIVPGSRLRITGVCDDDMSGAPEASERFPRAQLLSSLKILLRSPQDVTVLSGPPWWTWKKTAALVGTLLVVSFAALLWVHLLHRRLERQKAAQLAFSQLVLGKLEEERRRIAVNLHDSLGQTLLVIKNHAILANQPPKVEPGVRNRLDEISGTTTQAIEEVRRITHDLRPYQLDRLGLTQAIRTLIHQAAENARISFASRVEDIDGSFDKDAEIHVYRIVQEAITNIIKHAGATETTVVIKKRANLVSISIRDNGKGFDPAKLYSRHHELGFGLTGIGERVRILKGTLTIDSKPGAGTSVTVDFPCKAPPTDLQA